MSESKYLPLAQARFRFPGHPAASSLSRWATDGVRGVVLKTVVSGGKRLTTDAWVAVFLSELNGISLEEARSELVGS